MMKRRRMDVAAPFIADLAIIGIAVSAAAWSTWLALGLMVGAYVVRAILATRIERDVLALARELEAHPVARERILVFGEDVTPQP